jgi:hypothetical protein
MRLSDHAQKYICYYEIAKSLNFWSLCLRFFAGFSAVTIVSLFISLFYKKSIDLTFKDKYESTKFTQYIALYISIITVQVVKLIIILIHDTFACLAGFLKTSIAARRNYNIGKISIIIYSSFEALNTVLCMLMYSKVSVPGGVQN